MARIAVYTDHTYHREGTRLFVDRAFPLFLVELARHLDRLVVVGKVDPRPGRSHYELPPEIGFAELPYFKSVTRPISAASAMAGALRRFWRALADVDGVWLFGPHPLSIAFVAIAVARGRRVTLGVRQDFPRYVRARHPRRRLLWVLGDLMEALWRTLARRLGTIVVGPELAARYPGDAMEVSISLVSETELLPAGHAGPSWEEEELRVLSVGRLEREKNPLLLVEVLARLLVADPRWRLVVCGEGPLEADMRRRAEELGVAERLTLRGYVAQDGGLRDIYRSSHLLLHVSFTEGVPQVLFEAFAARLPAVATAVGGVAIAAADAALLIEPGDAEAAAASVLRVAVEPALRRRLTEAGAEWVAARTLEAEAGRAALFLSASRRGGG